MARDASGNDSSATAVAIQSDGGIVVAGSTGMYLAVVRYLPDGTEDPNFQQWNASGAIGSASSVVIQPNNMILVGGTFVGAQWYYYGVGARGGAHPMDRPNNASYSLGVARFNVDGSLDTSFNSGASFSSSAGYVTDGTGNGIGCGMALQPDGSLIVAGGVSDSSNPLVPSYVPVVERVTAGDIGGSEVRVDNASPALPLSGDGYVAAGDTYTLTLGSPLPAGEGQGEGSEGGEPINLGSGTDVSYTINWNDGTPATTITADDLAAAGDQVTHIFTTTSTGITVDLTVDSTPYYEVGSLAVNVDTNTATNTSLSITNSPANFGDTVSLQATVAADLAGIGAPTGTVEFYDQIGSGPVIDLGPGDFDSSTGIATLTTPPLAGGDHILHRRLQRRRLLPVEHVGRGVCDGRHDDEHGVDRHILFDARGQFDAQPAERRRGRASHKLDRLLGRRHGLYGRVRPGHLRLRRRSLHSSLRRSGDLHHHRRGAFTFRLVRGHGTGHRLTSRTRDPDRHRRQRPIQRGRHGGRRQRCAGPVARFVHRPGVARVVYRYHQLGRRRRRR